MAKDMREVMNKAKKTVAGMKSEESDKAKAEANTRKKYPQMYDKDGKLKPKYSGKGEKTNWVSRLKKAVKGETKYSRSKTVEKQTGLSEKELKRLR